MLHALPRRLLATAVSLASATTFAADGELLDTVSVTATRTERPTKEVAEAVAVIDQRRLEQAPMFNISDVLGDVPGVLINSNNGGYDARLVIRGAGLKAAYGIREIMLLRDGVPITDPDSFTRLDFVDTQDIERLEVTKGPGNLYAAGSAGGTVQIISKSVFDRSGDGFKLGYGSEGTANGHLRYGLDVNDDQALALTFSHRKTDNDWRRHNHFDTTQLSLKHGMFLGSDDVWETELSYTEANLQFPGDMDQLDFAAYLASGKQTDNNSPFDNTGRYSRIWFLNSRLELVRDGYTLKPRLYYNNYSHYHPVTGRISVTPGAQIFGADVELLKPHRIAGSAADFTGGVTWRMDVNNDDRRYTYADRIETGSGRIIQTLSDRAGDLMEVGDASNTLYGFFLQESLRLSERLTLDAGGRMDWASISSDTNELLVYDYASGGYRPGAGMVSLDRDFALSSAKLGLSYALMPRINAFASVAQADQVPFANELDTNPDLDKATVRNVEFGLKGRARNWRFDTSVYWARGMDEVVQTVEGFKTTYVNAGETDKKGFEFAGSLAVARGMDLGLNYAYSDYTYRSFTERVGILSMDRSGNRLPFVPRHKYTLFTDYDAGNGLSARVSADSWGNYYMNNANDELYGGYDLVTNIFVGYERGAHRIGLNIDNLFDKRYAIQAELDAGGSRYSYVPGRPRSLLLSYRYAFDGGKGHD
jgi:iron complex outermembrane receptor protein